MVKYRELTAEERTRDMYERREKARRDAAMHQKAAIKQIAKKLLEMSLPVEQVIQATGLTREEVESLVNDK